MTGDLNTTFGHRPIYIYGEAATFIPNSSFLIRVELSNGIKDRHAPGANSESHLSVKFYSVGKFFQKQ